MKSDRCSNIIKMQLVLLALSVACAHAQACYWNRECPYSLHGSKTPYASVRGDIRDFAVPQNCEAVSIWTLNRHGNRNPGNRVTDDVRYIASLKDEIIASHEAGTGQLCAQDISILKKWTWNDTLDVTQSYLTGTGYEELFDIGSRIREKYPHLFEGQESDYYFRPTNEQRTITSALAYVHGLSEGTNLTLNIEDVRERDDVVRPYENCDRYQQEVKSSQILADQVDAYYTSADFITVHQAVQQRLGLSTQLTPENVYSLYELCRFDRSWSEIHQSPWCAAFSTSDLEVLEYNDDLRHYYRNGYGSWVNVNLGGPALRDLYENFAAVVQGQGRKVTSYFTHDTMMEMVWCAMGVFQDPGQLEASFRDTSRVWRSSFIGAFSSNLIVVLNRCQESNSPSYRVQFFINERETEVCPLDGCTWEEFQNKFQKFATANLEFCSLDYKGPEIAEGNGSFVKTGALSLVAAELALLNFRN